ncbi:MAG: hypothetical protein ACT4P6_23260 [Gemmatimonadaceae bacterium]
MIRAVPDTAFAIRGRAIALFSVADSVDSREDTRGLLAASNLQIVRGSLVISQKTRNCPNATRANEALTATASMFERGVGDETTAAQLRDAYDQMRPIAEAATKRYCPGSQQR